ncbi:hypothetical protein PRIPAC_84310 [Pristionchus pacificus]|uniref:Uncharacterized protein n=1 Tax=Pristionchus pacificus TaxID=54126 RepID=A0A2A6CCD1_PRIPA|nr:hypothetical protein PRIPAC_84310 [Pristionchus pacificus]|eukprot:PDM75789.1 hypothetical protein PRIPAC_40168 [Pristionchus pacificus]
MICLYSWLVVLQALALSMSEPGYNVVKGSEKRRVITRGQSLSINDCKTSCMLMPGCLAVAYSTPDCVYLGEINGPACSSEIHLWMEDCSAQSSTTDSDLQITTTEPTTTTTTTTTKPKPTPIPQPSWQPFGIMKADLSQIKSGNPGSGFTCVGKACRCVGKALLSVTTSKGLESFPYIGKGIASWTSFSSYWSSANNYQPNSYKCTHYTPPSYAKCGDLYTYGDRQNGDWGCGSKKTGPKCTPDGWMVNGKLATPTQVKC